MLTFIRKYHPSPRVRFITALFLPLGEAGEDTTGLSVSGFMALPRDLRWSVICEIATDPCYAFKPGSRHLDEQLLPLPWFPTAGEVGTGCGLPPAWYGIPCDENQNDLAGYFRGHDMTCERSTTNDPIARHERHRWRWQDIDA